MAAGPQFGLNEKSTRCKIIGSDRDCFFATAARITGDEGNRFELYSLIERAMNSASGKIRTRAAAVVPTVTAELDRELNFVARTKPREYFGMMNGDALHALSLAGKMVIQFLLYINGSLVLLANWNLPMPLIMDRRAFSAM